MKKYAPGDSATLKIYRIGNTLDTGDYMEIEIVFEETTEEITGPVQNQSGYPSQQHQGNYPAAPKGPIG